MKGFMIYETPLWGNEENTVYLQEVKDASYTLKQIGSDYITCYLEGIATKDPVTKATCNKEDTYDFEIGALIALMKKCGAKKAAEACCEAFPHETSGSIYRENKRYIKRIKELEEKVNGLYAYNKGLINEIDQKNHEIISFKALKKDNESFRKTIAVKNRDIDHLLEENKELHKNIDELFESDKHAKSEVGRLSFEKHRLEEKVEKLKLDCEMLQHGYIDTDMMLCGGRACGKQYKALVELFKKLPQDKVDAAYKEAYNTKLPLWQKEVLKQMYGVYKESKEKPELPRTLDINGTVYRKSIQIKDFGEQINNLTVDSLIEENRAFTRKCVEEWFCKHLTKREEMWRNIKNFKGSSCIEVNKADVVDFLKDLEKEMPEVRWSTGAKPTDIKPMFDYKYAAGYNKIYFFVGEDSITFGYDKETSRENVQYVTYLPPMRWDLFKKRRIVVGIKTGNELEEFRKEVERNTGIKDIPMCPTNLCLFYSFDKDNYKIILETIEKPNIAKINGHKVYYWEDVR